MICEIYVECFKSNCVFNRRDGDIQICSSDELEISKDGLCLTFKKIIVVEKIKDVRW